jgi:hypothetical protein
VHPVFPVRQVPPPVFDVLGLGRLYLAGPASCVMHTIQAHPSTAKLSLGEDTESASDDTETHRTGGEDGQPVGGPGLSSSVLSTGRGGCGRAARSSARGGSGRVGVDGVVHVRGEGGRGYAGVMG